MGGSKGGDGEVEISEYSMSLHIGVCAAGEGLQFLGAKYGEKEFLRSAEGISANTTFPINRTALFGGIKKEGGVKGLLWWLNGNPTQTMPASLAARLGLTTATCPGFRGLASIFLTGTAGVSEYPSYVTLLSEQPSSNRRGFFLAANNPYLRSLSVRVRRPSIGLDPAKAFIQIPNDSAGRPQYSSNPAHMIYECLTNTAWGMGEGEAVIDKPTFEACATTLYNEGFGLNMIWTRQSSIEKFIGEILNHIQAALYVDPKTGKHTMKLLRGDYIVAGLPTVDPSNANLKNFKRKVWGEIANEIVVTFTNTETGKDSSVTAQDLAGIAAQGGVVSTGRNYYGIPYEALAIKIADRDLAMSVNPIATCEAEVSRQFWDQHSGDCVKLSWPEYDIEQIVFRVSTVTKTKNTVILTLYEDIFGLDQASYLTPNYTGWIDPASAPQPLSYYQVGTMPAFLLSRALRYSDASQLDYPEAMAALTIAADSADDVNYDLLTSVKDVNGTTTQQVVATRPLKASFVTLAALPQEITSTLSLGGLRGAYPVAGDFVVISTEADANAEIATVQSVNPLVLNRGMLDTTPKAWAAGTRIFIVPPNISPDDVAVRSVGEAVSYKFLTRTSLGVLAPADAPSVNVTVSDRAYKPNRPANVKVNGVGFGPVSALSGDLVVTWANRNRYLESTQAMKWNDATVSGESGQTIKISVANASTGATLVNYPGLVGTTFTIPRSALAGMTAVNIRVFSSMPSIGDSLQAHMIRVNLT